MRENPGSVSGRNSGICLILALTAVLTVVLTAGMASGDWTSFRGGPENRGFSDDAPPRTPNVIWERNLKSGWIDPTPAVFQGRVYVFTNGEYDFSDNRQISSSVLFCLDEATGEIIWSRDVSDSKVQLSSPAVGGGVVAVGSSDGALYAFNSTSGAPLFTYRTGESAYGITSSPLIVGDRLVFGSGDGKIYCTDLEGGSIWTYDTGAAIYFSSPAVLAGRVYIGNDGGELFSLDLQNGALIWSHDAGGKIRTSPLAADERIIFVRANYSGDLARDGWLRALSPDGKIVWEGHTGVTVSSPATDGERIYVGNDRGELLCLDTEGQRIWNYSANGPVQSSPAAVRNGVLFTTNVNTADEHSTLFFLNKHGAELFRHEISPHQWALSSPAIGEGTAVFASDNGWVYCMSENGGGHEDPGPSGSDAVPDDRSNGSRDAPEEGSADKVPGPWLPLSLLVVASVTVSVRVRRGGKGSGEGGHTGGSPHGGTREQSGEQPVGRAFSSSDSSLRSFKAGVSNYIRIAPLILIAFLLSAAGIYLFYNPLTGSEGSEGPVEGVTLIIDFGPEEAPINHRNTTVFFPENGEWRTTATPSDRDVWRFENLSSREGTVLDCLERALDIAKKEVSTQDYVYGTFVSSIAGVENGRAYHNWLYWVNGDFANMASDVYPLEDGDEVLWKYSDAGME